MSSCARLQGGDLESLLCLDELEALVLGSTPVEWDGLVPLADHLPRLKTLSLYRTLVDTRSENPVCFAALCAWIAGEEYHQLTLSCTLSISDTVSSCTSACTPRIAPSTPVHHDGRIASSLVTWSCLESLDLGFTFVTDSIVRYLPRTLRHLTLPFRLGHITDEAVHRLALEGPPLASFSLGGPQITDAAVQSLLAVPTLTSIGLWHSRVTEEAVDQLCETRGFVVDDTLHTSRGTHLLVLPGTGASSFPLRGVQ